MELALFRGESESHRIAGSGGGWVSGGCSSQITRIKYEWLQHDFLGLKIKSPCCSIIPWFIAGATDWVNKVKRQKISTTWSSENPNWCNENSTLSVRYSFWFRSSSCTVTELFLIDIWKFLNVFAVSWKSRGWQLSCCGSMHFPTFHWKLFSKKPNMQCLHACQQ